MHRPDREPITSFTGEHAFLSNFFPHPVEIEGDTYPTAEHAFQARKTDDPAARARTAPTPAAAKALGKRVPLRAGWDTARFAVMDRVIRAKFADPTLAAMLAATGGRELVEGSTWQDTTWGCVLTQDGLWRGRNERGKTLMRVRAELDTTALKTAEAVVVVVTVPAGRT